MTLTDAEKERYSRMLKLRDVTSENMKSLTETKVAMVGAGGLGSAALRLLVAIGFGSIKIIDGDIVELSNIQRQTVYNTSDIGRNKAEAAADNLKKMNPNVEIQTIVTKIDQDNADILLKDVDIIVDGLDSFLSRRSVNAASVRLRVPYIFAGAVEYYGNISTFIPRTTGCLHCMLGDARDNPEYSCAQIGITPTLLSVVGGIQVREAVLLAMGKKPLLAGRLMTVDMNTLAFDLFEIRRADKCPVCGS